MCAPARLLGRFVGMAPDAEVKLSRLLVRRAAEEGGLSNVDAGRSDAADGGRGKPNESRLTWLSRLLGVSDAASDVASA